MMTDNPPAFIDFEASSLDLIASYPIEVGVCLANGEVRSWLIEPHVLWQDWSDSAEQIHGITRSQLEQEGVPVQTVARELNRLITGPVYCDAWTFDSFWLHRLYRAAGQKTGFQLDSVSTLLNSEQVRIWSDARRSIIAEEQLVAHRAATDALILRKTWQKVMALSPSRVDQV